MFVLTVDQIDSRHRDDRVDTVLRELTARHGDRLDAGPARTAGDEFQLATSDAATTLRIALELVRTGEWSVGLGIGDGGPAGADVRAMSGPAFVSAREAVTAAKKRSARFALAAETDPDAAARLDALVRLLIALRERRTDEGWELADLLDADPEPTLTEAAERLGISVQAASQRSQTAGLRLDREARDALVALLSAEDARIAG